MAPHLQCLEPYCVRHARGSAAHERVTPLRSGRRELGAMHPSIPRHPVRNVKEQDSALSRRMSCPSFAAASPSDARGRREDRAPAGTHGPRATKKARGRNHRFSRDYPAFPARMVLTAYSALSPVTGLFCHRHPQGSLSLANLAPASGRQDHTAWPSARAPVVCCRTRVHRIPPPRS